MCIGVTIILRIFTGYLGISGICPTELMCASSKRMMVRAVSSSTNNDNVHMTGDVSIELSRWAASAQVGDVECKDHGPRLWFRMFRLFLGC